MRGEVMAMMRTVMAIVKALTIVSTSWSRTGGDVRCPIDWRYYVMWHVIVNRGIYVLTTLYI